MYLAFCVSWFETTSFFVPGSVSVCMIWIVLSLNVMGFLLILGSWVLQGECDGEILELMESYRCFVLIIELWWWFMKFRHLSWTFPHSPFEREREREKRSCCKLQLDLEREWEREEGKRFWLRDLKGLQTNILLSTWATGQRLVFKIESSAF